MPAERQAREVVSDREGCNMTQLVRYEQARTALAECQRVAEVKDIRDKAEAMAAYARQAKDTALVEWATEIKVRAEKRCGEMLALVEREKGGRPNSSVHETSYQKVLRENDLDHNAAYRYQQLAAMPDDHFETAVATAKDTAGQVTTAFMLREAAKSKPHGKPKTGPKADAMRAELKHAMSSSKTQLCVYARLLIDSIKQQEEFSEQEHELLAELADAINSTRSVLQ